MTRRAALAAAGVLAMGIVLTGCAPKSASQIACETFGGTYLPTVAWCTGETPPHARTLADIRTCADGIRTSNGDPPWTPAMAWSFCSEYTA